MKRKLTFILGLMLLLLPALSAAQVPSQVAGFVLGDDISAYKDRVKMQTALPIRYAEYLTEVETIAVEGFKSGLITYGNCAAPGRIVRIKLKYENSSKKFFEALLERYKKRFGDPEEWRGDPFHILIAWKWSFTDSKNNHVSMILQHNTKDEEEKLGNAVKMTSINHLEAERLCFEKKHPDAAPEISQQPSKKSAGKIPWDRFLPK